MSFAKTLFTVQKGEENDIFGYLDEEKNKAISSLSTYFSLPNEKSKQDLKSGICFVDSQEIQITDEQQALICAISSHFIDPNNMKEFINQLFLFYLNERHSLLELFTTLILKANNTDDILSETVGDYLNQISILLTPPEKEEEVNIPPSGEALDGLSVFSPPQSPAKNSTATPFGNDSAYSKHLSTSSIEELKKFTSFGPSDLLHPLDSHQLTGFVGLIVSCIDYILDIDLSPTGTFGAIPEKAKTSTITLGGTSAGSSADFLSVLEMPFDRDTFCISLLREISLLYDALFLVSYTDLCAMRAKDYSTVIRKTSMLHHKLSLFIERYYMPSSTHASTSQTQGISSNTNSFGQFSFTSLLSAPSTAPETAHSPSSSDSAPAMPSLSTKEISTAVRAIQLRASLVLVEAMKLECAMNIEKTFAPPPPSALESLASAGSSSDVPHLSRRLSSLPPSAASLSRRTSSLNSNSSNASAYSLRLSRIPSLVSLSAQTLSSYFSPNAIQSFSPSSADSPDALPSTRTKSFKALTSPRASTLSGKKALNAPQSDLSCRSNDSSNPQGKTLNSSLNDQSTLSFVLSSEHRKLISDCFAQWIKASPSFDGAYGSGLELGFKSFGESGASTLSSSLQPFGSESLSSFSLSSSALTSEASSGSSSASSLFASFGSTQSVISPSAAAFGFDRLDANAAACASSSVVASVGCVAWSCLLLKHIQCGLLDDCVDDASAGGNACGENELESNGARLERANSVQLAAFGAGGAGSSDGTPMEFESRLYGQQRSSPLSSLPPLSLSQLDLTDSDTEEMVSDKTQMSTVDLIYWLINASLLRKPFEYLLERLKDEEAEENESEWCLAGDRLSGKEGSGLGEDTSEWDDAVLLFDVCKGEKDESNKRRKRAKSGKFGNLSKYGGYSSVFRRSSTHKQVLFGFKNVLLELICVVSSTLRASKLILPSILSQIPEDIISIIQQHDASLTLPSPSPSAGPSFLASSQPPPTLGSLLTYLSEATRISIPSSTALSSLLSVVTHRHPPLAGLYFEMALSRPSLASLLSEETATFPADCLPAARLLASLSQDAQSAVRVCEFIGRMDGCAVVVPVSYLLRGRASFGWKSMDADGKELKWDDGEQVGMLGRTAGWPAEELKNDDFGGYAQAELEALQEKAALLEEALLNAQHVPFIRLHEEFPAARHLIIPSGYEGQIIGYAPLAQAAEDPTPLSFTLPLPLHFLNAMGLVVQFFPQSPYSGWPFLLRPFFALSAAQSPADILNPPMQMAESCSSWQKIIAKQPTSSLSTTHASLLLIHSLIRAHPPIHKVIDQQLSSAYASISNDSSSSLNTSNASSIFDSSIHSSNQSSLQFSLTSSFSSTVTSASSPSSASSSITSQTHNTLQTLSRPVSVANVCILLIHSISSQLTSSSVISSSSESERKQLLALSSLALRTLILLVPCWLPFCRSSCCPSQFVTGNGTALPESGVYSIERRKSEEMEEDSKSVTSTSTYAERFNLRSATIKTNVADRISIEINRMKETFVSLFSARNVELNTVIHDAMSIVTSTESKMGSYQTLLALLRLCRVVASSARCIKLPALSLYSIIKEASTAPNTSATSAFTSSSSSSSIPVPLKQEEPQQLYSHTPSSTSASSSLPLDLLSISSFNSQLSVDSLLASFPLSNPSVLLSEINSIVRRDVFVMIPNVWIHHSKETELLLMLRCADMLRLVLQSLPIEVAISNRKRRIKRIKLEAARNAKAKAEGAQLQTGRLRESDDFGEYDDGVEDMLLASVEDRITADEKEKQLFPSRETTSMENVAIAALTKNIDLNQNTRTRAAQTSFLQQQSKNAHLQSFHSSPNPLHQSRAELLVSLKTDPVLQKTLLALTASGGLSMSVAEQLSASGQQNIAAVLEETVTACLEVVEIVLISLEFDWREKESSRPSESAVKEQEAKVSEMMNGIGSGSNAANIGTAASSANGSAKGKQANSSTSASALRDLSQFERLILTFLVDVPAQNDCMITKQTEHKETAASKLLKELLETRNPNDASASSSESYLAHSGQTHKQESCEWLLVIASYIAYQSNNKISTVSTRILTHLCRMSIRFPQLPPLIRFFGSEKHAMLLKDAIVLRFSDPNTPHSVSAAVVEFISAAIDYQPLLAKLFVENVLQYDDKNRNGGNLSENNTTNYAANTANVLSENSFLGFSLSLLCDHLEETADERPALLAGTMLLLRKLWGKCDVFSAAVDALAEHEGFWKAVQRIAEGVGKKLMMMSGRREGKWAWKGKDKESSEEKVPVEGEGKLKTESNNNIIDELRMMRKQKLKWQPVLTPSCLLSAYASNDTQRCAQQRNASKNGNTEDCIDANENSEDSILFRTLRNLLKKWDFGEKGDFSIISALLRGSNGSNSISTSNQITRNGDLNIDSEVLQRLVTSQREEEKKIEEIDRTETMDAEQTKGLAEDRHLREMRRMRKEIREAQRKKTRTTSRENNGNGMSEDEDELGDASESSSSSSNGFDIDFEEDDSSDGIMCEESRLNKDLANKTGTKTRQNNGNTHLPEDASHIFDRTLEEELKRKSRSFSFAYESTPSTSKSPKPQVMPTLISSPFNNTSIQSQPLWTPTLSSSSSVYSNNEENIDDACDETNGFYTEAAISSVQKLNDQNQNAMFLAGSSSSSSARHSPTAFASLSPKRTATAMKRMLRATCHLSALETARSVAFDLITIELSLISREAQQSILRVLLEGEKAMENNQKATASSATKPSDKLLSEVYINKAFKLLRDAEQRMKNVVGPLLSPEYLTELTESVTESISAEPSFRSLLSIVCRMNGIDLDSYHCAHSTPERSLYSGDTMFEFHASYFEKALMMGCFENSEVSNELLNVSTFPVRFIPYLMRLSNASSFRRNSRIRTLASWKRFVSTAALCRSMIPVQPIWKRDSNENESESERDGKAKQGSDSQSSAASTIGPDTFGLSSSQSYTMQDDNPSSSSSSSSSNSNSPSPSQRVVCPSPLLRAVFRSLAEGTPLEVFKPLSLIQQFSSSAATASASNSRQSDFAPFELIPSTTVHLLCAIILGRITHIFANLSHSTDAAKMFSEGNRFRSADRALKELNFRNNSDNSKNISGSQMNSNKHSSKGTSVFSFEERLAEQSVAEAVFLLKASERAEKIAPASSDSYTFSRSGKGKSTQIPFSSHFLRAVVEQKEAAKQKVTELMNELLMVDDVGRLAQFDVLSSLLSLFAFLVSLCEECPKPMNATHYFLRFSVESEYVPVDEIVSEKAYSNNSARQRCILPLQMQLDQQINRTSVGSQTESQQGKSLEISQMERTNRSVKIVNESVPLFLPSNIPLPSPFQSDSSFVFLKQTSYSSPVHHALSIRLLSASSVPPSLNIYSSSKQDSSNQISATPTNSQINSSSAAAFDSLLSLPYFSRLTFAPYSLSRPASFPKPSVAGLPLSFAVCLFTQLAKCFAACLRCLFPLKSRHLSAIVSAMTSLVHLLPAIPSVVPLMKMDEQQGFTQNTANSVENVQSTSFDSALSKSCKNVDMHSYEKYQDNFASPVINAASDASFAQFLQPTSFADFDEGRLISPMNQMMSETSTSSSASILQTHLSSVTSSIASPKPAARRPHISFSVNIIADPTTPHSFPTFAPVPLTKSSEPINLANQSPHLMNSYHSSTINFNTHTEENEGVNNKKTSGHFGNSNQNECECGNQFSDSIYNLLVSSENDFSVLDDRNDESVSKLPSIEEDVLMQRMFFTAFTSENHRLDESLMNKYSQSSFLTDKEMSDKLINQPSQLVLSSQSLTSYLVSRHFPIFPTLYHYSRFIQRVAFNVTRGCIALLNYNTPMAPLRPGLKMIAYTLIVCLIQRILFRRCTIIPDIPQGKEKQPIDEEDWNDSMLKAPDGTPYANGSGGYANPSAIKFDNRMGSSIPSATNTLNLFSKTADNAYENELKRLQETPKRSSLTADSENSDIVSCANEENCPINYRQIITPLSFKGIIHCLRLDEPSTLSQILSGLNIPISNIKPLSFLRIPYDIPANSEETSNFNQKLSLYPSSTNSASAQETPFLQMNSAFIKSYSTFSPASQFNFRFVQLNLDLIQSLLVAQPFLASFFFNAGLINKLKAIADNLLGTIKEEHKTWDKSRLAAYGDEESDLSQMTPAYFREEFAQQSRRTTYPTTNLRAFDSAQSEEEFLTQPFNTPTIPYLPNGEINTQHRIWCLILSVITAFIHALLIQHNWKSVESAINFKLKGKNCYGMRAIDTKLGLKGVKASIAIGTHSNGSSYSNDSELPPLISVLNEITRFVNERLLLILPSIVRKTYPYNHFTIDGLIEARLVISLVIAIAQLSKKCGEDTMKRAQSGIDRKSLGNNGGSRNSMFAEDDYNYSPKEQEKEDDSSESNESEVSNGNDSLNYGTHKSRFLQKGDLIAEERRLRAMKYFHEDIQNLASPKRIEAVWMQLGQSDEGTSEAMFASLHRAYPWTHPSAFLSEMASQLTSQKLNYISQTQFINDYSKDLPNISHGKLKRSSEPMQLSGPLSYLSSTFPAQSLVSSKKNRLKKTYTKLTLNRIAALDGSDFIFGLTALPSHQKSAMRSIQSFPRPLLPLHPSIILALNELFASLMHYLSTPTSVLKELLPVTSQEKASSLDPFAQSTHLLHSQMPEQQSVVVSTISAPSFYSLSSNALPTGSLFRSLGFSSVLGSSASRSSSTGSSLLSDVQATGSIASVGTSTTSFTSNSASSTVLSSPFGETIISLITTIIEQIICYLRIISPMKLEQPPLPKRRLIINDSTPSSIENDFHHNKIERILPEDLARKKKKTFAEKSSNEEMKSLSNDETSSLSSMVTLHSDIPKPLRVQPFSETQQFFKDIPDIPCLLFLPLTSFSHISTIPPFTIPICLILSFIDFNTTSLRTLRRHPIFCSISSSSSASSSSAPLASILFRSVSSLSANTKSTFVTPYAARSEQSPSFDARSPMSVGGMKRLNSISSIRTPSTLFLLKPSLSNRSIACGSSSMVSRNEKTVAYVSANARWFDALNSKKALPGYIHPNLGILMPSSILGIYKRIKINLKNGDFNGNVLDRIVLEAKRKDAEKNCVSDFHSPSVLSVCSPAQFSSRNKSLLFGGRRTPPPSTSLAMVSIRQRSLSPNLSHYSTSKSLHRTFSRKSTSAAFSHSESLTLSPEMLFLKKSADSTRVSFHIPAQCISLSSKPFIGQNTSSHASQEESSSTTLSSFPLSSLQSSHMSEDANASSSSTSSTSNSISYLQNSLSSENLSFASLQSLRSDICRILQNVTHSIVIIASFATLQIPSTFFGDDFAKSQIRKFIETFSCDFSQSYVEFLKEVTCIKESLYGLGSTNDGANSTQLKNDTLSEQLFVDRISSNHFGDSVPSSSDSLLISHIEQEIEFIEKIASCIISRLEQYCQNDS
ncbi:uncharacterized protein MONOS_332 [Monocercomonoides exilis]|uniref:uncharacterized protein n=1 Tax=Monocercomonoides exilis TaxID=2049356 RepID=UPI0035598F17|nr:hypothetical protein MONOS_332 [Monocercomonoides exilis]|eukprot:MONOS_332.1-p1 / transcript=MONOS_332.1 / gene=MONOS_332 / organism=Monocercomonoides_exilis_PA203 / gene_product=unspecified product / transcript_product=unspecified product / location=Mono_scaffold00005:200606-217118(-) / protein_length=5381 / sequence_SO=supercontig / SO=protein_coding / is_pseudo=false